jgi:hypothetical protein
MWRGRKVEANAMVIRPEPSRQLLRDTIAQYVDPEAPERYLESLAEPRQQAEEAMVRQARQADQWYDR